MNSKEDIEKLEKVIGQLQGFHAEISALAKKSPNDALNPFKLKLINKVLEASNEVLGDSYRPFDDFQKFEQDDVPSNSDVTVVIAQYMEEAERYRSDNVKPKAGSWYYVIKGEAGDVRSGPPSKIGRK